MRPPPGQYPSDLSDSRDRSGISSALCRAAAEHPYTTAGEPLGIEIPAPVRQALGLEDTPSWVIVSAHSIDECPNAGPSPLPGPSPVQGADNPLASTGRATVKGVVSGRPRPVCSCRDGSLLPK